MEGWVGLAGVGGRLCEAVGMGGSQGRQCAVVLGGGCGVWKWRGVADAAEMALDGWW